MSFIIVKQRLELLVLVKAMNNLICLLFLLQAPLVNQTKQVNLQKTLITEKITISKLDPKDLAHLIQILNIDQFQRFKR